MLRNSCKILHCVSSNWTSYSSSLVQNRYPGVISEAVVPVSTEHGGATSNSVFVTDDVVVLSAVDEHLAVADEGGV